MGNLQPSTNEKMKINTSVNALPLEILSLVFQFLDDRSYRSASMVSTFWRQVFCYTEAHCKAISRRQLNDTHNNWKEIYEEEYFLTRLKSEFAEGESLTEIHDTVQSQTEMMGQTTRDWFEWQGFRWIHHISGTEVFLSNGFIYCFQENCNDVFCLSTGKVQQPWEYVDPGCLVSCPQSPYIIFKDPGTDRQMVLISNDTTGDIRSLYSLSLPPDEVRRTFGYSVLHGNLYVSTLAPQPEYEAALDRMRRVAVIHLRLGGYSVKRILEFEEPHQYSMYAHSSFFVIGPLFPDKSELDGTSRAIMEVYSQSGNLIRKISGPLVRYGNRASYLTEERQRQVAKVESELLITHAGHILLTVKDSVTLSFYLYTPEGECLFCVHEQAGLLSTPLLKSSSNGEALLVLGSGNWFVDVRRKKSYVFHYERSKNYRKNGFFLYGFDSDSGMPKVSFIPIQSGSILSSS